MHLKARIEDVMQRLENSSHIDGKVTLVMGPLSVDLESVQSIQLDQSTTEQG